MNPADFAICVLAVLEARVDDPSHQVEALVAACDDEVRCIETLAVLWHLETAGGFTLKPSSRHAFGPVQVLPVRGLTPDARTMRDDPVAGLRAGWSIWKAKERRLARISGRTPTYKAVATAYNGHPKNRERYGRKAERWFQRTAQCR